MEKLFFGIEGEGVGQENLHEGYFNLEYWNGWAIPYFEKEETVKILNVIKEEGSQYREENGSFYVILHPDDDMEECIIDSYTVNIDGTERTLYRFDIGFIWDFYRLHECEECNNPFTSFRNNKKTICDDCF